jgi:cytidylate kinase
MPTIVAIDGPSASGKSTVARRVAERLGYWHVDSGAVYRGVTWRALLEQGAPLSADKILATLPRAAPEFFADGRSVRFRMAGADPGDAIRSEQVSEAVSLVAAQPEVRAQVNEWLRGTVSFGSLVMEGRDIGTVVFPQAAHKFYLDASPEERARRRQKDLARAQAGADVDGVKASLLRRDDKDRTRRHAPLQVAAGALVIDTTNLTLDDVVAAVLTAIGGSKGT